MAKNIRVTVDGHVHAMGDDEHTVCGLLVPPLTEWEDGPIDCPDELPKKKVRDAGPAA